VTAGWLALGGFGCGDCTETGCRNRATLVAPALPAGADRLSVCADGRCVTRAARTVPIPLPRSARPGTSVPVRVVVRAGRRRLRVIEDDVQLKAFSPNGESCGPTCAVATVRPDFAAGRLVRTAAPGE
jgi:hypothetical protein